MAPRVRVQKEIEPEEIDDVLESLAGEDQIEDAGSESTLQQAAQRKFTRVAYYSAACSMVLVIVFAWLSSYYVIALETRLNETTSTTMQQFDARIARLESGGAAQQPQKPKVVQFTVPEDAPRLGSADAKVTIVEFADFQCPYCGKFQQDVYPQIKKEYIDTGKASFVYQDFSFLGEESNLAAEAAKCAADQGKFWEYHDYLFSHQKGENKGAFAAKNLKAFAKTVQLNTSLFNKCLDSGSYAKEVEAETASGRAIGVSGTPTVLVNGKVFVGALPFESFKQAIDEALAQ